MTRAAALGLSVPCFPALRRILPLMGTNFPRVPAMAVSVGRNHQPASAAPRQPPRSSASAPRPCANGANPTAIPARHWPGAPRRHRPEPRRPARRARRPATSRPVPPPCSCSPMAPITGATASAPDTGDTPPVGEICFNTGLTGYQETMTDPSYAGPDHHLHLPPYRQCRRQPDGYGSHHDRRPRRGGEAGPVTEPSNWRSTQTARCLAARPEA